MDKTPAAKRRELVACEFNSRLGYLNIAGATGVQLAFIRPVRSARYRDLQLDADGSVLSGVSYAPPAGCDPRIRYLRNDQVRKPVKRRSSNLRDRLWVRFPPVLLEQHASAGHWRAHVAVTHTPSGCGGSTPSRRTDNMARSSSGRMRDPHSRGMGSIPIRVTDRLRQHS